MTTFIVSLVSVVFAAIRVMVPPTKTRLFDSYKAFAHLWVGGLFGAYFAGGGIFLLQVAIAISLVELAMFLYQRKNKHVEST